MLSLVWEGIGKPDTSLPTSALRVDGLPRKLLGFLAATGRGAMASEHLRDDTVDPFARSYALPGWGNLHGHHVEELYGSNMELISLPEPTEDDDEA